MLSCSKDGTTEIVILCGREHRLVDSVVMQEWQSFGFRKRAIGSVGVPATQAATRLGLVDSRDLLLPLHVQ